jgi:N-formylglutamate amidohydrolase
MILHIPHASRAVPEDLRDQIVLSDAELEAELTLMTDAFTDELFTLAGTPTVRFPISRLLVDVERFADDSQEPMSEVGMGMIYTRTAHGKKLRRTLQPQETRHLVGHYYKAHHERLLTEVGKELEMHGQALIVDCHSFPSQPLPCDQDQSIPRPDFCIGTDAFHTPKALIEATVRCIEEMSYRVGINQPYAGTLVPMAFYHKDRRVASIMIEVNRSLYMDELDGTKSGGFDAVKGQIQILLDAIRALQS